MVKDIKPEEMMGINSRCRKRINAEMKHKGKQD